MRARLDTNRGISFCFDFVVRSSEKMRLPRFPKLVLGCRNYGGYIKACLSARTYMQIKRECYFKSVAGGCQCRPLRPQRTGRSLCSLPPFSTLKCVYRRDFNWRLRGCWLKYLSHHLALFYASFLYWYNDLFCIPNTLRSVPKAMSPRYQ